MNTIACKIKGLNAGMEFIRVYYDPTFVDFNQMRGAGPIEHLREVFPEGVGFKVTFDIERTGVLIIPKGNLEFRDMMGNELITTVEPFWIPAGEFSWVKIGEDLEFYLEAFTAQEAHSAS